MPTAPSQRTLFTFGSLRRRYSRRYGARWCLFAQLRRRHRDVLPLFLAGDQVGITAVRLYRDRTRVCQKKSFTLNFNAKFVRTSKNVVPSPKMRPNSPADEESPLYQDELIAFVCLRGNLCCRATEHASKPARDIRTSTSVIHLVAKWPKISVNIHPSISCLRK